MPPMQISLDEAAEILDNHHLLLDELIIVIGEGNTDRIFEELELSNFLVADRIRNQTLPQLFAELGIAIPTIITTWEDSSICPSSITFKTCNESVSLPLYDVQIGLESIRDVLSSIPSRGDEQFPVETEDQDKLWEKLARGIRQTAFGQLSSYLSREKNGITPAWYCVPMFARSEDAEEFCQVVITITGSSGYSNIFTWSDDWNALEEHDGPSYHTTWKPNSTVEVTHRDTANGFVYFQFQDEDGKQYFRIAQANFDGMMSTLSQWGWSFIESTSSTVTMVSGNNNYGTISQQPQNFGSNNRPAPVSPTPGTRPTQQRPGASVDSGIISGNVNISGLAQINGIVQGDVSVPNGADVNLNGIVQGTVRISGGTARLYGTISAASISSGRLEVYGILQTPLQYSGGDVYYDPNSIIG
jgi:hypothetical protein